MGCNSKVILVFFSYFQFIMKCIVFLSFYLLSTKVRMKIMMMIFKIWQSIPCIRNGEINNLYIKSLIGIFNLSSRVLLILTLTLTVKIDVIISSISVMQETYSARLKRIMIMPIVTNLQQYVNQV
jgi:hypothetical protein